MSILVSILLGNKFCIKANGKIIIDRSWFYLSSRTRLAFYLSLCLLHTVQYVPNLRRIFYLHKCTQCKQWEIQINECILPLYLQNWALWTCIFPINLFQIPKFMCYYHNQLLPLMILNLFETLSCQVHNYCTRVDNNDCYY